MSKVKSATVEASKPRNEKRIPYSGKITAARPYSGREAYSLMTGQNPTNEQEPVAAANVFDVRKLIEGAEKIQEYIAKGGNQSESESAKPVELSGLFSKRV